MLKKSTVALAALTAAIPVWAQDASCPDEMVSPYYIEAGPDPSHSVSVEQAIALALENDFRREAAQAAMATARTKQRIASFRPPDQINIQTEDFPRSDRADDIDTLEATLSYARVWERGDKREARETVAARGVDIARADAVISDHQIAYDVRRMYAAALVASARQAVVCMQIEHIEEISGAVDERVRRSADPVLASVRVSTELIAAQTELQQYQAVEAAWLEQLSILTGQEEGFTLDPSMLELRPYASAMDRNFVTSPDLLALNARQREADARIQLAQANRKTDVTWTIGVRNYGASDDFGLVTGVSIPIGQGVRGNANAARARAEERAINAKQRALLQQVQRESAALHQSSAQALTMLEALDSQLIPEATEALELAEQGYASGALPFRDILDAHELLIGLQKQRLNHLETFLMNDAALQRLGGDTFLMEKHS